MATRAPTRSPRPAPRPAPRLTAQRPRWGSRAAGLGVALGVILGPGTPLGTLLILAGVAALVSDGLRLLGPWRGPRTAYGVRYHADTLTADQAAALGRALTLLAGVGGGALTVTWQRRADLVTCHIRTPPGSVPALTRILAYFLPELRLEPLPGVPALLAGAGWYVRR